MFSKKFFILAFAILSGCATGAVLNTDKQQYWDRPEKLQSPGRR